MAVTETSLKVIGKMSRRELKQAILNCFEHAPEASPIDRLAVLQEAQFYTQELERRHDSWISLRDFVLEILVVGLIGWEIGMSYRAERLQTTNFKDEKTLFESLQKSSGATADSLLAAKDTLTEMNLSLQRQVQLLYEVQLNVIYHEQTKRLRVINDGRTTISIWTQRIGAEGDPVITFGKPFTIAPSASYELPLEDTVKTLTERLGKTDTRAFSYRFHIKNARQEPFTIEGNLIAKWRGESVTFDSQPTLTVPGWKK